MEFLRWNLVVGCSQARSYQNNTNTKRTVHRMYTFYHVKTKSGSASCGITSSTVVRLSRNCFFCFSSTLLLNSLHKKQLIPDNLSLISKMRRGRFVVKVFCQRRCMHTIAICLNNLLSPFLKSPLMKSHC